MLQWLPAWLGEAFSTLYAHVGEELYTFSDVKEMLQVNEKKALLLVSLLRRRGFISVFGREGRRKLYRTCDPRTLTTAMGLRVAFSLKNGRYRNLVLKTLHELNFSFQKRLQSMIVFGSVARGAATAQSDLDVLVIGNFDIPFVSRIDDLCDLEYGDLIGGELEWLKRHGVNCHVSWFPLTPEEATRVRPIYFDLVEDALFIYDRDGFFQNVLNLLRAKMLSIGSRRVWLDKDKWFWIIKPSIKPEEALSIEEIRTGLHQGSEKPD